MSELEDALTARIRDVVREELAKVAPTRDDGPADRLRTVEEICNILSISPPTLRRRVRDKTIPCVRMGDVLRFDLAAVREALAKRRSDETAEPKRVKR